MEKNSFLLRRLASGLRRQDWVTVAVELVIVVAGIMIALQFDDWAQDREERRMEAVALQRLLAEAENAVAYLQRQVDYEDLQNERRRQAVVFVESSEPPPEDDLVYRIGVNTMIFRPPLVPVRTAYDDITSGGHFRLIRSEEVRDAIALYYAVLDYYEVRIERPSLGDFWTAYSRHVTYRYNAEAEDSDVILSTYDWASLRADRDFRNMLIGELRSQLSIQLERKQLLRRAKLMCEALASATATECEPMLAASRR